MKHNKTGSAILIVEDEILVRMVAVDILSETDLITFEAEDAEEALLLLAAYPNIVMLFTDVNMPGLMDGMELARRVHFARPDIGIIVTSGRAWVPSIAMPNHGTFLAKPYRREQLLMTVEAKLALAA